MSKVSQIKTGIFKVVWREWMPRPDEIVYVLTLEDSSGGRLFAEIPYDMYMLVVPGDQVKCSGVGTDGNVNRFELL